MKENEKREEKMKDENYLKLFADAIMSCRRPIRFGAYM